MPGSQYSVEMKFTAQDVASGAIQKMDAEMKKATVSAQKLGGGLDKMTGNLAKSEIIAQKVTQATRAENVAFDRLTETKVDAFLERVAQKQYKVSKTMYDTTKYTQRTSAEIAKSRVEMEKLGVAGGKMGDGIKKGSTKGFAAVNDLDKTFSKMATKWSKFIISFVFAGAGIKVIMDVIAWTKQFEEGLAKIAQQQDAAGEAAKRLYGNIGDIKKATEAMHMAVGALGFEFKKSFVEGMGKSVESTNDLANGLLQLQPLISMIGGVLGAVAKGWSSIFSGLGELLSFAAGKIIDFVFMIPKAFAEAIKNIPGMEAVSKQMLKGMDRTKDLFSSFWKDMFVIEPQKLTDIQTVIGELGKAPPEVKKIKDEVDKLAEAHKKAFEANQNYLRSLQAGKDLTSSWMPTVRDNVQQISDVWTQLGIKTEDVTKMNNNYAETVGANSTLITDAQWQQIEMNGQIIQTTKESEKTYSEMSTVVSNIISDLTNQITGMISSWIGGANAVVQAFSKIGGQLGGAMGGEKGIFGKLFTGKGILGKIGGAIPGIGNLFGGLIGSIGGSLIGGLIGLFRGTPEWKKVGREAGQIFGKSLTDETMKSFYELSKKVGKDSAFAQMFSEMLGPITDKKSMQEAMRGLKEIFTDYKQGLISVQEAGSAVGDTFTKMIELLGAGVNAGLIGMIQATKAAGLEVKEITDYVNSALGETASGISAWSQSIVDAYTAGTITAEEYRKELQELNGISQMTFDAMIAGGSTLLQAWDALGAAAPFKKMVEGVRPLLEKNDAQMQAFSNYAKTGIMDLQTFSQWQNIISGNYDKLIAGGLSQSLTLREMAPSLNAIAESAKAYGFEVDANTQKLIDQAKEAGLMKNQQLELNNIMIEGFAAIITALGGQIPEAWRKVIAATNQAKSALVAYAGVYDRLAKGGIGGGGFNKYEPDVVAQGGFYSPALPRDMMIQAHRGERVDIGRPGHTYNEGAVNLSVNLYADKVDKNFAEMELLPLIERKLKKSKSSRDNFYKALMKGE